MNGRVADAAYASKALIQGASGASYLRQLCAALALARVHVAVVSHVFAVVGMRPSRSSQLLLRTHRLTTQPELPAGRPVPRSRGQTRRESSSQKSPPRGTADECRRARYRPGKRLETVPAASALWKRLLGEREAIAPFDGSHAAEGHFNATGPRGDGTANAKERRRVEGDSPVNDHGWSA